MLSVKLPFPDNKLSPNARLHWAKRHRASKQARTRASLETIIQWTECNTLGKLDRWMIGRKTFNLKLDFHPPAAYRYDMDNLIARMKASLDGISDGLGVDDVGFNITNTSIHPPIKADPHVVVTIS